MIITPLGTNGFFPSFGRQTACYAIPYRNTLIILDAGSGLFRLAEKEGDALLRGISEVHLYLSHYHLDHTFGFYAAFKLLEGKKVTVFASGGRQVFSEFITMNYFPIDYSIKHKNFHWKILEEGTHRISSYNVSIRKQNHRGEDSLAFRFNFSACAGRGVAYVTDSEPTRESIEFVKDVPLLLHEHTFDGKELFIKKKKLEEQIQEGHATTIGASLIAREAKVGRLVLIHHYPFYDEGKLKTQLLLARTIFPRTILATDLKRMSF